MTIFGPFQKNGISKKRQSRLPADLCISQLLFIVHKVNYPFNYNPIVHISISNPNRIFFRCFHKIQ